MTDTQPDVPVEPRVLRALGHPLRQRILHVLNARVASPSELSHELGERLANVSYHVKILVENDAIELVRTEPVRGALEHFYRATMQPRLDDAHWSRLPSSSRRELFDSTLQSAWEEISAAARDDRLGDSAGSIHLTSVQLDREARAELATHLAQTLELAQRLERESRARRERRPGSEKESAGTAVLLAQFERAADRA